MIFLVLLTSQGLQCGINIVTESRVKLGLFSKMSNYYLKKQNKKLWRIKMKMVTDSNKYKCCIKWL